ncbi:MAG TPA: rhodanese-like domain-containing protein [Gaiellaceae bacterium]|nr:rhodanese-like domain-containing protein [Gaiellaceae bacterium]
MSSHVSEFPSVVDAQWLAEHLGDEDLVVGDVRGPNAHARGHIPGSRPLVLGSPPPSADAEYLKELAREIVLRLRRHGITGTERLVLVDRGDGVGAMPAAQLAELAGHPRVSILLGGMAGWQGEIATGPVELTPVREAELVPNLRALPTREELAARLDDASLTILDVRRDDEYTGRGGSACDPRQGHIPGAKHVEVGTLYAGPGRPESPERIRALVGAPEGAEIVAYCHSGSRSALATLALRSAGYDARNYAGSWHEWSRHTDLPVER